VVAEIREQGSNLQGPCPSRRLDPRLHTLHLADTALNILSRGNLSLKCVSQVLPVDRPRVKIIENADRGHEAVAVNGESVHVEDIAQNTAAREAVDGAGCATHSVARGVDCQQLCVLPRGDGTVGHSVSIERGAWAAA